VKLTVYFTDWQAGEQREIPGVIAVRAFINAPDIQQLLLGIHPDGAGRGEVAFYIAGGAAFGNVLIPHRRDSPCDFHNVPFLTHTKTRSVQNGPKLFMYEKYFLDIFQMVKKRFPTLQSCRRPKRYAKSIKPLAIKYMTSVNIDDSYGRFY
jgi:hypothetical protein